MSRRKSAALTKSIEATCVHGVTGQDVSDDTLAAGALVRDLDTEELEDGVQTSFLASTDGRNWYQYRTWSTVVTA